LFSCYTGLRYGDNKKFTLNDIENNCINVLTEKTKKVVVIPLLPQAKELLNYELAVNLPNLNTPCDQTCNRALKEIALACKIHKPISTHYARHTFACIALNNGVSKPTVQSFLGHKANKPITMPNYLTQLKLLKWQN
jgi:integrase